MRRARFMAVGVAAMAVTVIAWGQHTPQSEPPGGVHPGTIGPVPGCPAGMVGVPEGVFWMGTGATGADDQRHGAHVSAFCMDRTEVTVEAFGRCVSARACSQPNNTGVACNWGEAGRADHPINCVNWLEADAYCRWTGGRLPTEAEWEYGARGTDERLYPWGNDAPAGQLCWRRTEATCAVGSHIAGRSPFGLDDMAGNVLEWTADWYGPYTRGGPPASGTHRVDRGGGWDDVGSTWVRAAYRVGYIPTFRQAFLGFRCARAGT